VKKNQLSIRLYGEPVGILEQDSSGKKNFTYISTTRTPLSIGMPIREEPYGEQQCEAFFGGLLPESETARKIIGKKFGVSPNNSFALLRAIGYDCAGAISCHALDDPIIPQSAIPLAGKHLSDDELYAHIKQLPTEPLFINVEGLRLSLAGVQDKAAICLIDNQIAFPENGCPTTHILKPQSAHFEGLAENEYLCLKIAKRIGLNVAEVELRKIKDIHFLLIERYDRILVNNHINRIHQEDFCQALGVKSSIKYENEGGPSLKDCFDLLKITTQPAIDRNQLAAVVVFNYLISNMDAHAKNFSLLHTDKSNIRLAPFYDIICTRVYKNLTSKMSMKIGSKYDSDYVQSRHWEQLCKQVGYRHIAMKNLIEQFGHEIKNAAELEKRDLNSKGFNTPIIDKLISTINVTINNTLRRSI